MADGVSQGGKCILTSVLAPVVKQSSSGGSSSATLPAAAAAAPRVVQKVKRLDGTIEEIPVGLPPNNPNFQPRQTVWESKVVTNDKDEVKLRFYERKGMKLTPELEAKKAELVAAGTYEQREQQKGGGGGATLADLMGGGKNGNKRNGKKGGGGGAGAGGKPAGAAPRPKVVAEAPQAAPEVSAWYRNRPKGGVKVLGGAEGAVGNKRAAEGGAEGEPAAKK